MKCTRKSVVAVVAVLVSILFIFPFANAEESEEMPGLEITQTNFIKMPVENDYYEIYVAFEVTNVSDEPLSLDSFKYEYIDAEGNPVRTKYSSEDYEPCEYGLSDYPGYGLKVLPGEKIYSTDRWTFESQEIYDSVVGLRYYDISANDNGEYSSARDIPAVLDISGLEFTDYGYVQSVKGLVTNNTPHDVTDIISYVVLFDKDDKLIGVMDSSVGIMLPTGNSFGFFARAVIDISSIEGLLDTVGRMEGYSFAYEVDGETGD